MSAPMDKATLGGQRGLDLVQHMRKCVSDTSTCLSQMLRKFMKLFWLSVFIYKCVLKGVWDNIGLSVVWNSSLVSQFPVPDCSAVKCLCCFCLQVLVAVPVSWSTQVTLGVLLADLHSVMDSLISTLVCFEELSVGSHKYFVFFFKALPIRSPHLVKKTNPLHLQIHFNTTTDEMKHCLLPPISIG